MSYSHNIEITISSIGMDTENAFLILDELISFRWKRYLFLSECGPREWRRSSKLFMALHTAWQLRNSTEIPPGIFIPAQSRPTPHQKGILMTAPGAWRSAHTSQVRQTPSVLSSLEWQPVRTNRWQLPKIRETNNAIRGLSSFPIPLSQRHPLFSERGS